MFLYAEKAFDEVQQRFSIGHLNTQSNQTDEESDLVRRRIHEKAFIERHSFGSFHGHGRSADYTGDNRHRADVDQHTINKHHAHNDDYDTEQYRYPAESWDSVLDGHPAQPRHNADTEHDACRRDLDNITRSAEHHESGRYTGLRNLYHEPEQQCSCRSNVIGANDRGNRYIHDHYHEHEKRSAKHYNRTVSGDEHSGKRNFSRERREQYSGIGNLNRQHHGCESHSRNRYYGQRRKLDDHALRDAEQHDHNAAIHNDSA